MRTFLSLGLLTALAGCGATSGKPVPKESIEILAQPRSRHLPVRYLLQRPAGYGQETERRWPMILFLHGAGERGDDTDLVSRHGPPKIARERGLPFVIVSPQCPRGERWSNAALLALLNHVTTQNRIDPSRVYLTGLSMGGYGTWSLGLHRPERFAAIAPICGGGELITLSMHGSARRRALSSLGIWAFHGAKDGVVKMSESERMVEAIRRRGGKAKLTVYPDATHDAWTRTYAGDELYDWFLAHRRER